jgi:hypothetical protein
MWKVRRCPPRSPWVSEGQKTKEPRYELRTRPGPLVFFLIYVIVGGIIGIAINNAFYAIERAELSAPKAK